MKEKMTWERMLEGHEIEGKVKKRGEEREKDMVKNNRRTCNKEEDEKERRRKRE